MQVSETTPEDKDLSIHLSQDCCCWCPGDLKDLIME